LKESRVVGIDRIGEHIRIHTDSIAELRYCGSP